MESGSFELKVDCSEAKNDSGVEAVVCDFLRQCSLGDDGDGVSFLVGGYKFHVHQRTVLAAASPAFKGLLLGTPTAADHHMDGIIRVHGVEPETFRALLRFVYAGALPGDDEIEGASTIEMLRSLVAAADTFGMERLKLACAQKLSERVSAETVVATLGFAETHNCPELRKKCIDFLMEDQNLCKAAVSEGYVQLMLSFPSVVDEPRARLFFPRLESSAYEDFFLL